MKRPDYYVQLPIDVKCRCIHLWTEADGTLWCCNGKAPTDKKGETVNHPAHYGGDTTYEVIKVVEAWGWAKSYYRGTVLKYLYRAGRKDPSKELEDLKKARWYLDREIALKEGQLPHAGV